MQQQQQQNDSQQKQHIKYAIRTHIEAHRRSCCFRSRNSTSNTTLYEINASNSKLMQQQQQNDSQQKQHIKYAIRTHIEAHRRSCYFRSRNSTSNTTLYASKIRTHISNTSSRHTILILCVPRSRCQQQESLTWATWLETVVTPG